MKSGAEFGEISGTSRSRKYHVFPSKMPFDGEFFSLREQRDCGFVVFMLESSFYWCSKIPKYCACHEKWRFHNAWTVHDTSFTKMFLYWSIPSLNRSGTEVLLSWTAPLLKCSCTQLLLYWNSFAELFLYWTAALLNCSFSEVFLYSTISLLYCCFTRLCLYFAVLKLHDSEVSQPELPLRLLQIYFESNSSKSMEGHMGKWRKWPLPGPACHDIFINSAGWDPSWGGSAHVLAEKSSMWFRGTNLWWLCYPQKASKIHNPQRACTVFTHVHLCWSTFIYVQLHTMCFLHGQVLLPFTLMLSCLQPSDYSVLHGFGEEPVWRSSIPVLQVDHIFLHP